MLELAPELQPEPPCNEEWRQLASGPDGLSPEPVASPALSMRTELSVPEERVGLRHGHIVYSSQI